MSEYIVAKSVNEITLSTKFFNLEEYGVEIDIQSLVKADIGSEDAWINITPILQVKNLRLAHWLRNKSVKEYINIVSEELFKCCNLQLLKDGTKTPFPKKQWIKGEWLTNGETPLICTRTGKYHGGTWIHKELFVEFITVLDVKLRRDLHKGIMQIIKQSDLLKIERTGTKTLFHKLGDTIRDKWIPNQQSDNAKKFAYSTLMTLANMKVLGMSAKKYCKENGIEVTKDMISVRDALPKDILGKIKKAEEDINGLIEYGRVYEYEELKTRLGVS